MSGEKTSGIRPWHDVKLPCEFNTIEDAQMSHPNPEPCDEYTTLDEVGGVELAHTGSCFAVFFDVDATGDGWADDREMQTFDDEGEARDYFNQILQR